MGVLKIDNLAKAFGINTIFSGVSFEMRRGDKIGLIGVNGAGKTTLLRLMLGFDLPDSGRVIVPEGETIGYVEQEVALLNTTLEAELRSAYKDVLEWQAEMAQLEGEIARQTDETLLTGLMKKYAAVTERFERGGGYEIDAMLRRVAAGLGFTEADLSRTLDTFSGGQKTRIGLAKALVRRPDYLFLDEPTNHLDIEMVEWLEEFLVDYPGGVFIISHDRYFLDKTVSRILELENKQLYSYSGNYTEFLRQKAEYLEAQMNAFEKQQAYIAKTAAYIDKYRAGIKSKQARGRETRLARLERLSAPGNPAKLNFSLSMLENCADKVAEVKEVTAAYDGNTIFTQLSLLVRRGEGIALVGPNGAGKTTLLKLLTGELQPLRGSVKIGSRVRLGYFAQEHDQLHVSGRVLDEVMLEYGISEEQARNYLGTFMFYGDEVFKYVGDLSGGERARLALLKLMLSGANFLVLDEPTNHLDISAREAVEAAIMSFPGTFLTVSHDRYFLDKIADRVIELKDGCITDYPGTYSYYREKQKAIAKENEQAGKSQARAAQQEKRPGKPRQRPKDNTRVIGRLEEEIACMEAELTQLELRLNDPAVHADFTVSKELAEQYANMKAALEEKYEEWMELTQG